MVEIAFLMASLLMPLQQAEVRSLMCGIRCMNFQRIRNVLYMFLSKVQKALVKLWKTQLKAVKKLWPAAVALTVVRC